MADDEQEISAEDFDERLKEAYGELLDANSEIISISRQQAHEMRTLGELYQEQASRCDEIAELHLAGAQFVASTFGDILSAEFGFFEDSGEGMDDDGGGTRTGN